jgi:alkanesulfonate monooxygenase SsuD/methylene tetrahydromethanopterin reductase-like flavin-dependent oxidoreductase (luciferase family)
LWKKATPERTPALLFDYYLLNTYVPELDGQAPELYDKWLAQVDLAEELGFDCAWFTEHHFRLFGGMLPNPQVLMGALAQRTKRIRLGTAVSILPLHNPLRIAEDVAMLDVLSHGRIEVGVGRGMPTKDYGLFGADWDTAQDKLEEQIGVLRAAWTQDEMCWDGQFMQVPEPISVMPKPVQQPHPRLWMTANREASHFRWIGRNGIHLMTLPWILPSFDLSRSLIAEYHDGLREGGHDPAKFEVLAMFPVYVGDTAEAARREIEPHWNHWRAIAAGERGADQWKVMTYDFVVENTRAIFGDREMCRAAVRRIQDALGLTRLSLVFHFGGLSQERTLASMRLFAREVAQL